MADQPLPHLRKSINASKKKLVDMLVDRRKNIEKLLAGFADNSKLASSGAVRDAMFKELVAEYDLLQADIEKWAGDVGKTASKEFFEKAKHDMKASGDVVSKLEKKHVKGYVNELVPKYAPGIAATQTTKMLASDIRQLRSAVVETFRMAKISGWTARKRQMMLRDSVTKMAGGKLNSWQFIDKSGKKWNNGNYFNMLNRTTVANVSRNAYTDALVDNGHDLATIEGGGDPCPACSAWRGVVVSLSGANSKFPSMADAEAGGVFHPNCVCTPEYVDADVDKKLIDEQAKSPNPAVPDKEAWNEYAKGIQSDKKARVGISSTPEALKVDKKLDKKLKAAI